MPIPFGGLTPAVGREHARWVVDAMTGREGVDLVVPEGFETYVRVHHRIHNGERWADFAPEYLTRGLTMYEYRESKLEFIDGDGNLDADDVDALVPLLASATGAPDRCHYALWDGWGWVHRGSITAWAPGQDSDGAASVEQALDGAMRPVWTFAAACPVEPWWGGRDMILFDGPVDAVGTIGHAMPFQTAIERQCPQWWWPDDRAWFVGSEIDHAWTYVAGPRSLVDQILASPQWESVAIEPTDRW